MDSTELTKEQTSEEQASENEEKKSNFFNDFIEILETMLISIFVVLILFTYLMRPVTVDGSSMFPTLTDKDRLVMWRLLYHPHQGDIVVVSDYAGHVLDLNGNVIESGSSLRECLIKRVIAVGGQMIDVRTEEGLVYVDGTPLDEPYVNEPTLTNDGAFSYPITVPEGYVFVMGDNRNHSTDSRSSYVGLVKEEDVLGCAYFRYCSVQETEDGELTASFDRIGFIS